jgi:hypothetical protein
MRAAAGCVHHEYAFVDSKVSVAVKNCVMLAGQPVYIAQVSVVALLFSTGQCMYLAEGAAVRSSSAAVGCSDADGDGVCGGAT